MEQDQEREGNDGTEASAKDSRQIIGQNDGVVGEPNYDENHEDHDVAECTQSRTELERVPRHCCCSSSWSLYDLTDESNHGNQEKKNPTSLGNWNSISPSGFRRNVDEIWRWIQRVGRLIQHVEKEGHLLLFFFFLFFWVFFFFGRNYYKI